MPYKRKGRTVYKKTNGWKKKGRAKSTSKAKRYERLLRAVEHGWKPTGKKAKKRTTKTRRRKK